MHQNLLLFFDCSVSSEPLGGVCVFASEINQKAITTYKANFKDGDDENENETQSSKKAKHDTEQKSVVIGDISEYYTHDLPQFDILTAGFPCQPFTV